MHPLTHSHRPNRRTALLAAVLALATVAAIAVLTLPAGERRGDARPAIPTAGAPTVTLPDLDFAQVRWEALRGGAVTAPTAMAATTRAPRITELPLAQYRRAGSVRVFRDRPFAWQPQAIVLHATGSGAPGSGFANLGALHRYFARPAANASSHYAIDRAGRVARFVPDDRAAFHVATPGWNDVSIGIELLNDNSGAQPFPPAQLRAAAHLARWLGTRYAIPVEGVVRHRTVQPVDRADPAANFPWREWLTMLQAPAVRP